MANYDFESKVLVLTGASGGIGKATAEYFFECGAKLALSYHNNQSVRDLALKLDPTKKRVFTTCLDLTQPSACDQFSKDCFTQFGRADFLVNNAAILRTSPVQNMTNETWKDVMTANLDSVFYMCRAFIPILRNGGAIVNIASTAAHRGAIDHSAYAASKAGVLAFSRSLARELAPRIRCNGLSPGMIDTEMLQELPKTVLTLLRDESPYKRLGDPMEIAGAIAFLCSQDANFIAGETLHVNGGCYIT